MQACSVVCYQLVSKCLLSLWDPLRSIYSDSASPMIRSFTYLPVCGRSRDGSWGCKMKACRQFRKLERVWVNAVVSGGRGWGERTDRQTDRFICFKLQNGLAQKPLLSRSHIAHCVVIQTGFMDVCFRFVLVLSMEARILRCQLWAGMRLAASLVTGFWRVVVQDVHFIVSPNTTAVVTGCLAGCDKDAFLGTQQKGHRLHKTLKFWASVFFCNCVF